jgi:ATP-binding cassette subfamily F protein uup
MPPLINAQQISKQFGLKPLFQNISFTVSEGDRIGLIGPNGAGKSTLLQILEGRLKPDCGDVAVRKRTRLSCVTQQSAFEVHETVKSVVEKAMLRSAVPEADRQSVLAETLGRAGFTDLGANAGALSGGWRKRLAIVEGLVQLPDVLLLDEPTNHLDFAGIRWLETVLEAGTFATVVVSHDRYLLERVAGELVELNRIYEEGLLRVKGNYSAFLQAREDYARAQGRLQESLSNRVRNEIEWLRRGPKARGTKARARIETAKELINELADLNARPRVSTAGIDFVGTERRTTQLIELDDVECSIEGRRLFSPIRMMIQPGMRVGLVGPNGSGKTTLLRIIRGEIAPSRGRIRRADALRTVYFDQNRELDPDVSLKRTLAPDSDSVVYQDRVIHVASWASRFLFSSDALNQPVGRLSGGERARVLIAQLMLQPADVLLLDEPTNDLDIPTLEVLEDALMEFRGAFLLVTHDRYLMDRVSTVVLGLDGLGHAELFADTAQCDAWQSQQEGIVDATPPPKTVPMPPSGQSNAKRKLSYLEAREFAGLEERLTQAEEILRASQASLQDPAIASDGPRLLAASADVEKAQALVDELYARWVELDAKKG